MKLSVGLIGLGLMGRPMGANLLKAGFALTVWNRTASRADALVAQGARVAKTPREAAAASDVLITIVSDPPALEQVLWGPEGAFHWWGEPDVGYFLATDPWVIRRNLSMLQDAGVDVLLCDVTNEVTYPEEVQALCEVARRMRSEGNRTPAYCSAAGLRCGSPGSWEPPSDLTGAHSLATCRVSTP